MLENANMVTWNQRILWEVWDPSPGKLTKQTKTNSDGVAKVASINIDNDANLDLFLYCDNKG